MSVAAVAGHRQLTSLYVAFLLLEIICDFNDGWVYEYQEVGAINGYGLYLDHMVDVLAAACAAWGCYKLVGHAETVVTGLILYYAIALHSWLYKITQLTRGRLLGLYYSVTISKYRHLSLSVDDLALVVCIAAALKSALMLYMADGALLIVFVAKVVRATLELRRTLWRGVPPRAACNELTTSQECKS